MTIAEKEEISTVTSTERNMARINVTLPEDTLISLRGLAKESNVTISEFVRNALRVYSALLTERNEGKYVYLGTRDKIEKELLIP